MANLKNVTKKSKAQSMGMHTEVLTGRTQQKFFNPDEAENFYYFGTYDVDFNKRTNLDVKDMTAKEEDILTSQNLIEQGKVITRLLESIIADPKVKLNEFGYLKRNDWFHFGIGHNITKNGFPEKSSLEQVDIQYDFNYDSDTKGNSNPLDFVYKNQTQFKDTSSFNYDFRFKSSGKNTTITRKDPIYPFVKIKNRVSITTDFEAKNYKYWTYDWRMSFDKSSNYETWDSKGYRKRFFKIAGSLFPSENIKIRTEFRIKKEKEWLNWIDSNHLATYDLNQRIVSLNLNWFKGVKHEIRLKSQFVALEAKRPKSLFTDVNGVLFDSSKKVNPFSSGINSFQIRYKYEIAPLSNIYIVYTRGGEVYEEDDERSFSDIFSDPWKNPDNEIFSLKIRLKF